MTAVPPPPAAAPGAGAPSSSNGKALASMIVGIVSFLVCIYWFISIPGGIVALILGVLGKKEIAQGRGTNGGMAMTGIILGALALLGGLIIVILSLSGGGFIADFCVDNPDNPYCTTQ